MAPISEETWKRILTNQGFPLEGSNEPNNGNGFHDGISWRIRFRPKKQVNEDFLSSTFFTIYLRDLGLRMNPDLLSRKELFEKGLVIKNCSKNYLKTFSKYLANSSNYRYGDLLHQLGEWSEFLSRYGRLIYEIVGWYDNDSSQFYAYNLNLLDNEYCKISSNYVTYNAPFDLDKDNNEIFKKVVIPKSKCLIIEFPHEFGGYNGFKKKFQKIIKLGPQHDFSLNSSDSLTHWKNWDKRFNKIVSDWGASNKQENITEFYQELNAFRFTYLARLCTLELIGGLKQLICYLNIKLKEDAIIELNLQQYDILYYKEMWKKFVNGDLNFKEANEFLRL
jgi:hypothetical protein